MNNLRVGHTTNDENGTGVSVFLFAEAATGAYVLCGSAPASKELAVLDPENSVPHLHGLVFAGGSAFGLTASAGVMRYLAERGIGHPTIIRPVPIVPSACIYDFNFKKPLAPTPEEAYLACVNAKEDNFTHGRIDAGTGATVGKIISTERHMSGGIGVAELKVAHGVVVQAYAVVNSVGDVYDLNGNIIAGVVNKNNKFVNATQLLASGQVEENLFVQTNSTLVAVITNAAFSKDALKRIGKMAIAGIARAISPVFTNYDGDILFAISNGQKKATELTIGVMAAEAVRLAILDAVQHSEII